MKKILNKAGAMAMATAFAATPVASVMAAPEDIIDTNKTGSISLKKYDITAAQADGLKPIHANGEKNVDAEAKFADYAIKGVTFTYAKVADIVTYSYEGKIAVMYDIPPELASVLGLEGGVTRPAMLKAGAKFLAEQSTLVGDAKGSGNPMYTSDQINKALKDTLLDNTNGKNKLEDYIKTVKDIDVMKTDATGSARADNLKLGLYLIVETEVPANVHYTTDPFFVSVPMTKEDGSQWFYDVFVYPKNQTDIPDLDKAVRQHDDVGKDHGDEEYNHSSYENVATGSEGDIMDYMFVSHLPKITSKATYLSKYTFIDKMDKGLTYQKDTAIYFYNNKTDAEANNVEKAVHKWEAGSPNFRATYDGMNSDYNKMTVEMTEAGLKEINGADTGTNYGGLWMVVAYTCQINSDDTPVLGDVGNNNEVTLEWKRTNQEDFDRLEDKARVYTFGLNLQKNFADKDGSNIDDEYEGTEETRPDYDTPDPTKVQFVLQNKTDGHYVIADKGEKPKAGFYYVTNQNKADTEEAATKFSPDKDGKLIINGLEADTYVLTEIQTSEGYSLLKQPIEFTIKCTKDDFLPTLTTHYDKKDEQANIEAGRDKVTENHINDASATVDGSETNMSVYIGDKFGDMDEGHNHKSENAFVDMVITNTPSFKLPMTGGTGTLLCTLAGCGIAFGGVTLLSKKRK